VSLRGTTPSGWPSCGLDRESCARRVAEAVAVRVRFRVRSGSRSHPGFLALGSGFCLPRGVRGWVGLVIDHPPLSFAFNGGGQ
jgi:hypothetical protein